MVFPIDVERIRIRIVFSVLSSVCPDNPLHLIDHRTPGLITTRRMLFASLCLHDKLNRYVHDVLYARSILQF